MKRKLIAFSMTMALLVSVFSAANVGAFTATIEAPALSLLPSRAEWSFAKESDGSGIGIVQRNSTQQGAFIFNDTTGDQRLITTTEPVTREADLDFFAVTADASNLYFLAKVEKYCCITNDPSLELMITIDTNHSSGQGTTALPFVTGTYSTTQVTADAAWEYTLDVQFRKGTTGGYVPSPNAFRVFTDAATSSTCTGCLAQLAAGIPTGSFVEISVPWTRIPNAKPVGANYLRFSVASMYSSSGASNRQVPADGYNSPVIDVLGSGSTLADIQDGTIDTSFDVHFNTNGTTPTYEPYAPLVVTEFQPNPVGTDSPGGTNVTQDQVEWIEIYNPNSFPISLSDYKIGNTPRRNPSSSQGMFKFNSGKTIAAGSAIVVAKEKARFVKGRPDVPAASVYDLNTDLSKYSVWAGGDLQLDNAPGTSGFFEEQVVLLDAKDGIVDMATYGNTTTPYPGHTPITTSAVPEGTSYERCPATRDTNNSNVDFTVHSLPADQTPGTACLGVPGLDLRINKGAPANPVRNEATNQRYVNYTITYENIGQDPENGAVTVVDTLPAGLSFSNTPDNASPQPNTVNGQVLTWNFPAGLPAGAIGTIVLTATVDSSVGQNVPLTNNVSISGPSELEAKKGNNTAQALTTTPGPADTSVSTNLSGSVPPGAQFQFTITYRNTGQDDASDVVITNVLPGGVTILSEDSPEATWNNATTGTVTWNVGTLPANTSGTIVVTAKLDSSAVIGSSLSNALSITVPVNDPTPDNNAESKSLTVGLRKLYVPLQRR